MQIPHSFICPRFLLTPVKIFFTPIFVSSLRLPKLCFYISQSCSVRKSGTKLGNILNGVYYLCLHTSSSFSPMHPHQTQEWTNLSQVHLPWSCNLVLTFFFLKHFFPDHSLPSWATTFLLRKKAVPQVLYKLSQNLRMPVTSLTKHPGMEYDLLTDADTHPNSEQVFMEHNGICSNTQIKQNKNY